MTTVDKPSEPQVKDIPAQRVAYVIMKGSYTLFGNAMGQLTAWAQQRGIQTTGPWGGTYFSDPSTTPEAERKWEAWVPVSNATDEQPPSADGIGVKTQPSGRVASILHIGPYNEVGASYGLLFSWIAQQGLTPTGPPQEVYLSDPSEAAEADLRTEIRANVA